MGIVNVATVDDVAAEAANRLSNVVAEVASHGGLHGDGIARIVVTGGGAGIKTLKNLVSADLDWANVHIFFGDERNVPVGDPESNEGQAREALFDHVDIPEGNIHGYQLGELTLDESVHHYTEVLKQYAPQGFDLHLLGMGAEGHINSLFPHTDAVKEKDALVVAVSDSPKPPAERASLTLPAVNSAERVWLLVAGAEKREAATAVAERASYVDWPAAGAEGLQETLLIVAEDAKP